MTLSKLNHRMFIFFSLMFIVFYSAAIPNITSIANVVTLDDFYSYEITFEGWEVIDDLNVKFTYNVKSGGKPSISHWELYSCCFGEDCECTIVDSSEPYVLDTEKHMLKFDVGYDDYEERTVWFVIHLEHYMACGIGEIEFEVKGGEYTDDGSIYGPSCQPEFYIPETSFGTLGAIIPLLTALGLAIAYKKNGFVLEK